MTHADLVALCPQYATESLGCRCGLTEPKPVGGKSESPDYWGVGDSGMTYVIECKVSRADFLADLDKPHRRQDPLGHYRYYASPQGVVTFEDAVERRWGLLHVIGGRLSEVVPAPAYTDRHVNFRRSFYLLTRAMRESGCEATGRERRTPAKRSGLSIRDAERVRLALIALGGGEPVSAALIRSSLGLAMSATKLADEIERHADEWEVEVIPGGKRMFLAKGKEAA